MPGGECCDDGGSCLKGYYCAQVAGVRGCCSNGETCLVQETLSEIQQFTQIETSAIVSTEVTTSAVRESTPTSTADCTGPTITFYNFTASSTYILQHDCSCPAFESEGEGPTTTQATTIGMTCTITIPLGSSSTSTHILPIISSSASIQTGPSGTTIPTGRSGASGLHTGQICMLLPMIAMGCLAIY